MTWDGMAWVLWVLWVHDLLRADGMGREGMGGLGCCCWGQGGKGFICFEREGGI